MPTNNPRVSFALPFDLLKQIDEFRYSNRIKNQTQAIIILIKRGLESLNSNPGLPESDARLLAAYRAADEKIRRGALSMLEMFPADKTEYIEHLMND